MSQSICQLIDHALLHPTMTDAELVAGCELADRLQVATVCVKPYAVHLAAQTLRDSQVGVGTVIGFPHGSQASAVKAAEANRALMDGATELDMVVNVGKVLQGDWDFVREDIQSVVEVGHAKNAIVKVIFETDYVTADDMKIRLCEISEEAGADYVKTSTGFGFVKQSSGDLNYVGATESDVKLMRQTCSDKVGVKASGGIRSYEDALKFKELGCARLGTSASEAIASGEGSDAESY